MKADDIITGIERTDRNADRACTVDICIPVYRTDPSALVAQLARQRGAETAALRIYDDGSGDPALGQAIQGALARFPGQSTFLQAVRNGGRTVARNAMLATAESDWILLLDSDMRIEGTDFLAAYQEAAAARSDPCCIVGGFAIDSASVTSATRLHACQSHVSECLPARARAADPGRYVFTCNLYLHREIVETIRFDEGFQGWGWEDVDWGLRIAARYLVVHIDNPAVHLGLDTAPAILGKYRESARNFVRLLDAHPDAVARMSVYRWACRLAALPGRDLVIRTAESCAATEILPPRLRLVALKMFRAAVYGKALSDAGR